MTSPLHILIVEDNPGDAHLIARMLAKADGRFRHTRVETMDAAIETAASTEVDLILLDLNLPDSQGLDTLVTVHDRLPAIPIIVLTGLADEAAWIEAIHLGAQDYLVKGEVDARQLSRSIRYALERKQAEDALHTARDEWFYATNFIEDAVYLIDLDDRVVHANSAFYRMTAHQPAEVIGSDIASLMHPAGERTPCPVCVARRERRDADITMADDDPHNPLARPIQVMVRVIRNKAGTPIGILKAIHDLSAQEALRKSEELIRNILENVDEGFVVIGPDYRIITANRAFCQMGRLSLSEVVGRHCYEVSHQVGRPCFENGEDCAPRHTFGSGQPYVSLHTHRDSLGASRHIETKSFPIRDAAGRIVAVIETLIDITEKRLLEAQLRQAQKMEVIGRLAGGVAHDFNNMLNVIIGYAGILKLGRKPDDSELPHIKGILAAGERAARLTKGLLAFGRKQVMDIKPVDLNDIIDGFKKMIIRMIGEDVRLQVALSPGVLPVLADRSQIEQVLMNLATNARDAMPRGGELRIETKSVRLDDGFLKIHPFAIPGRYALLSFFDNGTGMDEKTREQIFEPFFTTKETGKGTGLGLSIVYGIVKQHNGFIFCDSEIGRGTTFSLYLPTAGGHEEKAAEDSEPALQEGTGTVLLAEDDASMRDFLRETLEMFGYTVIAAVDGQEAVTLFMGRRDEIQLLLFDLIMPGKNGREAYEEIRVIAPDVRVLFMSGYAADILQTRGGIAEGFAFLQKPFMPSELLAKVREVLGHGEAGGGDGRDVVA